MSYGPNILFAANAPAFAADDMSIIMQSYQTPRALWESRWLRRITSPLLLQRRLYKSEHWDNITVQKRRFRKPTSIAFLDHCMLLRSIYVIVLKLTFLEAKFVLGSAKSVLCQEFYTGFCFLWATFLSTLVSNSPTPMPLSSFERVEGAILMVFNLGKYSEWATFLFVQILKTLWLWT